MLLQFRVYFMSNSLDFNAFFIFADNHCIVWLLQFPFGNKTYLLSYSLQTDDSANSNWALNDIYVLSLLHSDIITLHGLQIKAKSLNWCLLSALQCYICIRLFLISRNRWIYLGKNKTTFTTFDIFACLIACRVSYRKSVGRRRPERKPTGDGATKQLPVGYHLGLIAVVVKQMSVVSDSFFLLAPN